MAKDEKQVSTITRLRACLKRARQYQDRWRKEAEESENFVAGHQWDESDVSRMKETQRPAITYNRIAPMLNSIVGTEIQHRQKMIFIPRHPNSESAAGVSDLATDTYIWALEQCQGEYERSLAFRDMITSGIGWVHTHMDFDTELDGKIIVERVPGEQVYFDEEARKQNLSDASWVCRQKRMSRKEIEEIWPDKKDEVRGDEMASSSLFPDEQSDSLTPTVVTNHQPDTYADGAQDVKAGSTANPLSTGSTKQMMLVSEYQWREKEVVYRFPDDVDTTAPGSGTEEPAEPLPEAGSAGGSVPTSMAPPPQQPQQAPPQPGAPAPAAPQQPAQLPPQLQQMMQQQAPPPPPAAPPRPPEAEPPAPEPGLKAMSEKEWKRLVKRLGELGQDPPPHVRQTRWVYRRAFCVGSVVLQEDRLPTDSFTYKAMTCYWDNKDNVFYGLVRAMKDPQRGANKYFSLGVHLFSISPKGTMLAETGAFVNPRKITGDWAKPGSIIHLKPGALANGMLKVEPPPPFPEAATTMIQFSLESLRDVTGINLEMMGQSEGSEPGPAIAKRQAQALTILAPIFTAYSRYRETEALLVLDYVKSFMTDGRLIRIGGPYNSQYVKLLQESFAENYDLMLDDSPSDPNQKMAVWEQLQPLLPMLVRQGTFPIALLDYAPLPTSVVSAIKREIESKAQAGQQMGQQLPAKKEQNPEYMKAEIAQKMAGAELDKARAQALLQESNLDMARQAQDIVSMDEGGDRTMNQTNSLGKLKLPGFPGKGGR
jgi:hypothetical protein